MYSTTCLVSTLVSTYFWLLHTLHLVPSSCTPCQPVLIVVSTSDKKYRFGVPLEVLNIYYYYYHYYYYYCYYYILLYYYYYYINNIKSTKLDCRFLFTYVHTYIPPE